LRALFPLEPGGADAVVVNTAGGVVGGDRLDIRITLAAATGAVVTSQAAEMVYRSAGATAEITTQLQVGAGGVLAWLPQETILFDACRLRRRLAIDLDPAATLLASEMLVFGRVAKGERLHRACLREARDVRIGGRLVWAERFRLDPPNDDVLDDPALLAGARALATTMFAAPNAVARLEAARAQLTALPGVRAGVTAVNGLLVGRFLGPDATLVRRSLAATLAAWRGVLLGQPARLPRLWAI
jgi:urease accessory protein